MDDLADRRQQLAERLSGPVLEVAPRVLGAVLTSTVADLLVRVRVTEVEAYDGLRDPGSHGFRGPTNRNRVLFGPAGRLYVYFTYGMHFCANLVTGDDGDGSGLLLRAGEVIEGVDVAMRRRPACRREVDLARGPARLASAMGIAGELNGHDLSLAPVTVELPGRPMASELISTGPRVGLSGEGGDGERYPWRFWITGDPTVSVYRPAVKRVRTKPPVSG